MNARTLLTLSLLSAAPSALLAQSYYPEPAPAIAPVAPSAPRVPKAPRSPAAPAVAPAPAIASLPPMPAEPATPPAPPVPVSWQTPPAPRPAPAPPSAPVVPVAPAPPRAFGQMLNVQIEVTLTDSKGSPKTVMLTVADGEMGQNRTGAYMSGTASGGTNYGFNADARPTIFGNKIRLTLSAEATVPSVASTDANHGAGPALSLRQSQTLILNDGDSVEIARAADPVTDRMFALSVKVKIQR